MAVASDKRAQICIKICGLRTSETVAAAVDAGADMLGFVFFPASPRSVLPQAARELAARVPATVRKVALLVDADDALIATIAATLAPDLLQLHGSESPRRAAQIQAIFGLPVMKAVGISAAADVAQLRQWNGAVKHLLVDAKAPAGAAMPGGHGRVFDWSLLDGIGSDQRFMLSGGLDPGNVAQAVRRTSPWGVDVSSGVEIAPGVKDTAKIRAFVAAARYQGRVT